MIYKLDDGTYVISSRQVWVPGCFENERTAKYAFRFKDEQLSELQKEKNKTTGIITFEDLQKLKKG